MCRISLSRLLAASSVAALLAAAPASALPIDATWLQTPPDNNFNHGSNWSSLEVPDDIATFGTSSTTDITINTSEIVSFNFESGAPAYTFNVDGAQLVLNGGITDASSNAPVLNVTNSGEIEFESGNAADAQIHATGGSGHSIVQFDDGTSAQNATITIDGSSLFFVGSATGGSANISLTNTSFASFSDVSTGGNAAFSVDATSSIDFSDTEGPSGDGNISVGSLAGAGTVFLGTDTLTVGSDNSSTEFSGVLGDCEISGNFCSNFGAVGGSLVKTGSGTLTLSGANIYTGTTTINGGTLLLNGSITSAVTVSSGGTLAGSGVVIGATVVNNGGTLMPGTIGSPSALTVVGDLTLASGANYVDYLTPSTTGLTSVTGAASIDGTLYANFAGGSYTLGAQYILITSTGALSGAFSTLDALGVPTDMVASLSYDSNDVFLNLVTSPFIWDSTPASGDFNTGTNWTGGTTPGSSDTAIFQTSSVTAIGISSPITVGALQFDSGASAYTFSVTGDQLSLAGGIVDNSSHAPVFNVGSGGVIDFKGGGAADAQINASGGSEVEFDNSASAAGATISVDGGSVLYFENSTTAASASITLTLGFGYFYNTSSASTSTISANNSSLIFNDSSMAASASISLTDSGAFFFNTSSAGTSTISADNSALNFANSSTAGSAGITLTDNSVALFYNTGSAGTSTISADGGQVNFSDSATAGSAGITLTDGAFSFFRQSSSAGSSTISADASNLYFFDSATAGSAGISLTNGSSATFSSTSTGGNAAFSVDATSFLDFSDSTGLSADNRVSIGSLSGAGRVFLGADELTLGGDNTSTTFSGVISDCDGGTCSNPGATGGSLVKTGTGTFTLSGDNTYTGGTTISGGTLQIGDGGTTGSIIGDVTDNGTLAFERSDAVSFGGTISGSGSLIQEGSGTLTLTGTSNYGSGTNVASGILAVNGSITSAVTVQNGGTLTGTGTVGATTVQSGGTLTPGALFNPATLTVNGDLALNSGATYADFLTPSTAALTSVTGAAVIDGALEADFFTGSYTLGTQYTLITSTGALSGTFSSLNVLDAPADMIASLSYDPNDVYLSLSTSPFIWESAPASGDFNTGTNWTGGTVPGSVDTAFFDTSSVTAIGVSSTTTVGTLVFDSGASAYTFSVTGDQLSLAGGIVDNSSNAPVFNITSSGKIEFDNGGAADAQINASGGSIVQFDNSASAAGATISADGSSSLFFQNSATAGSASITLTNGSAANFEDGSSAGTATISADESILYFHTGATAGSAVLTLTDSSSANFYDNSSAGSSTISVDDGSLNFNNSSTADSVGLTLTGSYGYFYDTSSAGSSTISADNGGLYFYSSTTAGSAGITLTDNSSANFYDTSSAGSSTISVDDGALTFSDSATAGSAGISLTDVSYAYFRDNSTGGNAAFSVDATSFLDFSDSIGPSGDNRLSAGSLSGSGTVYLGADQLTLGGDNTNTTFSGVISDCQYSGCLNAAATGGSLVKTGTGTFTLSGTNIYTGGTSINAGTLQIENSGAVGNGAIALGGGALLADFTGTMGNTVTFGDPASSTIAVTTGNTLTLDGETDLAGSANAHFGSLGNTGTVVLDESAVNVSLSGAIFVDDGTLREESVIGSSLITYLPVTVASGATLDFADSPFAGARSLSGGGTVLTGINSATVANIGSGNFSGGIQGAGSLQVSCDFGACSSGTLILSGTGLNTYAGSTYVGDNSGAFVLQGGAANAFNATSAVVVFSNATLDLGGFDQTIASLNGNGTVTNSGVSSPATLTLGGPFGLGGSEFDGTIQDGTSALALVQTGSGTFTLGGTNTYTGSTTINDGTLLVNGSITSAVTVNNGGTLGGSGTVGTTTVNNGGTLLPGAIGTPATLTVNGNLTLNSGASYVDFLGPSTTGLTSVTGTAAINGTLFANFASGSYTAGQYTLITSTGALGGTFSTFDTLGLPADMVEQLSYDGNDVYLNLSLSPFIWKSAPASGDFNTGTNWTGGTAPGSGDTAFFDTSSVTAIGVSSSTIVGTLVFDSGASAYTFSVGAIDLNLNSIIDNSSNAPVFNIAPGGEINFNSGSAADAQINLPAGSTVQFSGSASAATATISATGGVVIFTTSATADSAGITLTGAYGYFYDTSSAGSSTISADQSYLHFEESATAGSAAISLTDNSFANFSDNSTGGNAAFSLDASTIDFSDSTGPSADNRLSIGSLSGAGRAFLGADELTLGGDNTSTTFSGVISDCGGGACANPGATGGSLVKTGSGIFTLSGANTYTGGTTINAGTLEIENNAALGSGTVTMGGGALLADFTDTLTNNIGYVSSTSSTIAATAGNTLTLQTYVFNNTGATNLDMHFGTSGVDSTVILDLTGSSTVDTSDAVSVDGGTLGLQDGAGNAIASAGSVTIASGATLDASDILSAGAQDLLGGGTVLTGSSSGIFIVSSGNFSGGIQGTGNLRVGCNFGLCSGGTLILSGTGLNTYSGRTVIGDGGDAYVLQGGAANAFNATSLTTVSSGATLDLGGFDQAVGALLGNGTVTNSGVSSPAMLTVGGNNEGTEFDGTIQDGTSALGLIKTGSGSFILTGANSYSGGTDVQSGTLAISSDGNLGTGSLELDDGTTLQFNAGGTYTHAVTVAGDPTFDLSGASVTWSGNITDGGTPGDLVVTDGGALTLSGNNSYSGTTTITGGSDVIAGSATALGSNSALNLDATSELDLNGNNLTIGSLSDGTSGGGEITNFGGTSATLTVGTDNSDTSFSGQITDGSSTLALTKTGSGTLILAGSSNSYSGGTSINEGRLQIENSGAIGSSAITLSDGTLVADFTGTLTNDIGYVSGTSSTITATTGNTLTLQPSAFNNTGATNVEMQFGTSGFGSTVILDLAGTATIDASDDVSVNGGTLRLQDGAGNAIASADSVTVATGATLDFADVTSAGAKSLLGGGTVLTGSSSATTVNIGSGNFSGGIQGAGGLQISCNFGICSSGTLVLSGTGLNTYAGATYVGDGSGAYMLQGGAANAFNATSATNVTSGATLDVGGFDQTIGSLAGGGTVTNSGVSSPAVLTVGGNDDDFEFTGTIQDGTSALGIVKTGIGTFELAGTNSYSGGTDVQGGTLAISNDDNLGNGGTLALEDGTTLLFESGGTYTHAVTVAGDPTFDLFGASVAWSGDIADGATPGDLVVTDGGTLTLSGNNSYTGATTIEGNSTVIAGSDTALGSNSAVSIRSNAELDLNGHGLTLGSLSDFLSSGGTVTNDAGTPVTLTVGSDNSDTTFSGQITDGSGGVALTKTGTGTLALSGASNDYSGATLVNGGTLQIDGALTATSSVTVANNGTLRGSGSVGSPTEIQSGGTLAAGSAASIGTLALSSGSLTFDAGSNFALRISGSTNDSVNVSSGDVDIDSTAILHVAGISAVAGDYTLLSWTGALTGQFNSSVDYSGLTGFNEALVYNANDLVLDLTPADTFIWTGALTDNFENPGNWNDAIPSATTDTAIFDNTAVGKTVVLDNAASATTVVDIAGLEFDAPGYTFNIDTVPGGTETSLTLENGITDTGSNAPVINITGDSSLSESTVLQIENGSLADSVISMTGNSLLELHNASSADSSIITADHSYIILFDSATADSANISLTNGSYVSFDNASSAGSSTISADASNLYFYNSATADGASLSLTDGSDAFFENNSTGGNAGLSVDATSILDFSDTAGPSADNRVSVGSLSGAGTVFLGADELTLGGDNTDTTFSGVISDCAGSACVNSSATGGSLVKTGSGTLTLSGDNQYSGGTTLESGTLSLGNDGALGSGALVIQGGVVDYADTVNIGNIILLEAPAQFQVNSGTATQSGAILDTGVNSIEKIGGGTLILAAANDYLGGVTVTAGTLEAGASQAFVAADDFTVGGSGTLDLGGFDQTVNTLSGSGIVTSSNGAATLTIGNASTFDGVLQDGTGQLALTVEGGTTILTGANTYTGTTVICDCATLQIGDGSGTATLTSDVENNNLLIFDGSTTYANAIMDGFGSPGAVQVTNGDIIFTGDNSYSGGTTISAGILQLGDGGTTGSIMGDVTDNGELVLDRSDTVTFDGTISGSGDVFLRGAGTVILTAANSYGGGTLIGTGTLQLDHATGGVIDAASSGTIDFVIKSRTPTAPPVLEFAVSGALSNDIDEEESVVTIEAQKGKSVTLTGALSNDGTRRNPDSLIFGSSTDTGTIILDSSSLSGHVLDTLEIAGGTLQAAAGNNTLGRLTADANTTQIDRGGILDFNGSNATIADLEGTALLSAVKNVGATTTIQSGDFAGVIASGNLRVSGGTLTLRGVNLYSGTTTIADHSRLDLDGIAVIANSSSVTVDGTLDISGKTDGIATIATLLGDGTVRLGGNTLNINDASSEFSGDITDGGDGGGLAIKGTETLSGDNTYSGQTTIRLDSDLILVNRGSIADTSEVLDLGTFDISGTRRGATIQGGLSDPLGKGQVLLGSRNLTIENGAGLAFDGDIQGSGGLRLRSGDQTLNGTNDYTGATSVQSGTLTVNGSIASSAVTVGNNGTLTGTGAVGTTTVQSGGTLLPGGVGTIGTLTVNGDLTLDSGASYADYLAPGTAGLTSVTGTASIDGTLYANFASGSYTGITQYTLISSTGMLSGTFSSFDLLGLPADYAATLDYDNNNVYLDLSPDVFIWGASPPTSNWNSPYNWSLDVEPTATDTAIFDATDGPDITIDEATSIKSLQFDAGAPAYTFEITGTSGGAASLTVNNGGIVDNSSNAPTFNVSGVSGNVGTLTFNGVGSVADANINAGAFGTVFFDGRTNAGAMAVLTAQSGGAIDFTGTTGPAANNQISAGSIAGAGNFLLGGNTLTVGALNTSTEVSGDISGTGGLVKIGTGSLLLSGVNQYTGATMVDAGILDVNGSIAHSAVTLDGGTLKGHGTVGSVTIGSGGIIAPGNSIGTITVASASFTSGSTYQVETNAAGQSDLINDTGAATITGGTVEALPATGSYAPLTIYRILNANGGITGTFSSVTSSISDLTPSLVYGANTIDLRLLKNDVQFGLFGTTPNQIAAGNAVTASGSTSTIYATTAAASGTPVSAGAALSGLDGEIYASLRSALLADSTVIRDAVVDHLNADGQGPVVWGTGFGSYGWVKSDGNAADMHHSDAGLIAGVDAPVMDDLRLGLALALDGDGISVPDRASTARSSGGHVIGYAGWTQDAISVRLGADYGWGNASISRELGFAAETNTGRQKNNVAQTFADAGYRIAENGFSVEPYLALDWTQIQTDAFAETGGTVTALSGGSQTTSVTYDTLGVRLAGDAVALTDGADLVPRLDLGWQHAFNPLKPGQTLTFRSSGQSFLVLGAPLNADQALLQAGLDLHLTPVTSLSLDYDGQLSARAQDHAIRARLDWKF